MLFKAFRYILSAFRDKYGEFVPCLSFSLWIYDLDLISTNKYMKIILYMLKEKSNKCVCYFKYIPNNTSKKNIVNNFKTNK